MKSEIAIVGAAESVLAFRAAVDPYGVTAADALAVLKKIVKHYRVILLEDALAPECEEFVRKFDSVPYPVILPVPGAAGASGEAMRMLREAGEKALGVDILFHDRDK